MMIIKFSKETTTLKQEEVHNKAKEVLKDTFSEITINGYKYTENEIWDVLLYASINRISINSTCTELKNVPSSNWLYGILDKELFKNNSMEELERKGNVIIQTPLPKRLNQKGQRIAIDLVLIPFYGDEATPCIYRSQAKQSTTKFYCYASAYVIRKNKRVTLTFTFVKPEDNLLDVLKRLLKNIQELQIKIKRLYLDRAFARVDIFLCLDKKPYISIIPVPKKGNKLKELQTGNKSYRTEYTMQSQKYGEITFDLYIACKYRMGKSKKHGIQYLFFAVLGQAECNSTELQIAEEYTHRFGIETSYRVMNRVRAITTSIKPEFRLLLVIIAFFLANLWVWFKWNILLIQRRCSKGKIKFTIICFASLIKHSIEFIYQIVTCLKL